MASARRMTLLAASVLAWSTLASARALAQNLESRVKEYTLKNGMRFLLMERHESPTVGMYIFFRVGSAEEEVGKSGLAHMFEHMMFKGTTSIGTRNYIAEAKIMAELDRVARAIIDLQARGVPADSKELARLKQRMQKLHEQQDEFMVKDEFDELYQRAGGVSANAYTSNDITGYVIELPANKLELWAVMESDRMQRPVLREFYRERDVVMEERRRSVDTAPDGKLWEEFLRAAFFAHPYGVPVIGWPTDVPRLMRPDADRFFRTYYAPNNATAAIVGDFKTADVIKMIEKYFGPIPHQELPRTIPTTEPAQPGERRVQAEFDANAQMLIGYHKPTFPHPDNYVFEVIEHLLGKGRTSRFYKTLVEGKQLVRTAEASNNEPGRRFDNLIVFSATPRSPHTVVEVEQAIYQELDRLKNEPVPARELEKVRNNVDADFIRALSSNIGMAERLASTQALTGNWRFLADYPKKIRAVTADDIVRVAKKYFVATNRTVAELVKKGGAR